jgi:hypothetical protein
MLMVIMDNTIDHLKINGSIDLQRNSDFTNSSHLFQYQHDHLWVSASEIFSFFNKFKPSKRLIVTLKVNTTDYIGFIWQPPKFV